MGLEPIERLNHSSLGRSTCSSLLPFERTLAPLALPLLLLFNFGLEWYLQKALRRSSQTSALGTQYLVLDDCVPDPLRFVLIYIIIVVHLLAMGLIKVY